MKNAYVSYTYNAFHVVLLVPLLLTCDAAIGRREPRRRGRAPPGTVEACRERVLNGRLFIRNPRQRGSRPSG